MKIEPFQQQGYQLLHDGAIALAEVEANGICVDMDRLDDTRAGLEKQITGLKSKLQETDVWAKWKKRFGPAAKLSSGQQLATIFFDVLGFKAEKFTPTGRESTSEEEMQKIDHPFIADYFALTGYEKTLNTFLHGIEREVVDGKLHPVYNLHMARSMRSSSDSPNFQTMPVRDEESARTIRSLFRASKGCVLVENDFKGVEVSISACLHKDPNFISYITTPGKDMHRDMAAQLYKLRPSEVSKQARYGAKNKFVFPQFYGDYYVSCAKFLWEWIGKGELTTPEGVSLYDHLADNDITELGRLDPDERPVKGTFEHHVKAVEDDFWNNRFQRYGRWRKEWFQAYERKGYFDMHTGFRITGLVDRKQCCNYPIQGPAFHCLLWTLIEVNKILRSERMQSRIVGQIHDSMLSDVPVDELRDYLDIVHQTVMVDLRRHWKWINVPLEIETEICPANGTWFDKRPVGFKDGKFIHPEDSSKIITDPRELLAIIELKTP